MVHHRRGLRRLLNDDALLERIDACLGKATVEPGDIPWSDLRASGIGEKRLTMLRYVEKLTLRPGAIEKADVDGLRSAGFTDAGILAIVEVTGYYAYVNRIADGLGVALEDWLSEKS